MRIRHVVYNPLPEALIVCIDPVLARNLQIVWYAFVDREGRIADQYNRFALPEIPLRERTYRKLIAALRLGGGEL